jgi:hypothetical protein
MTALGYVTASQSHFHKAYMNSWSAEATDETRDRMTGEAKNMSDSPMLAVSMFSSYSGNDA